MLYMTSLNYKNVNEIFYWNRGKMLRIPDGFTSLDYLKCLQFTHIIKTARRNWKLFLLFKKKKVNDKKKPLFLSTHFILQRQKIISKTENGWMLKKTLFNSIYPTNIVSKKCIILSFDLLSKPLKLLSVICIR